MKSRFHFHVFLLVSVALLALLPLACAPSGSDDESTSGTNTGTTTPNGSSGQGTGGNCTGFCGAGGNANAPLTLVPPSATIDVVDGVASPVDFAAMAGGVEVNPTWQVDLSSIATVDGQGVVAATGTAGGEVVLTAKLNNQTATATVTVHIKKTINPGGVTPGQQDALRNAATQDASVVWAYPYDKTVFPKGLLPPEMMWNNSGVGDLYRVHLTNAFVDFEFFTTADPPSRFLMPDTDWTQITESGPGGKLTLEVSRLILGQSTATKVINHEWTIANGSMKGTIYYWSNNVGQVLRIKPGATAPENFLTAAGVTNGTPGQCTTCHAVSANGSTLILGGDQPTSTFNLLTNTSAFNVSSVGKATRNWAMPAISPDGNVLIENNEQGIPGPPGGSDGMWDTHTGQHITGTGLDGVFLDMPAFAPDGKKIAFVDHGTKGLCVYDYDAATKQVSNKVDLVPNGGVPGVVIAFPSVSPDHESVVYHRGPLDTRNGNADLFLARVSFPGLQIPLANLNGTGYPFAAGSRDLSWNYEPTFAPVNSGGYAWVVFTSRRTYGNRLTGGANAVKQLWVAAIDQNVGTTDPSHPAFRMPGQDDNLNMRGFWALDPCKQAGDSCATGSECCNKNCDMGVCKDPNPNGCSDNGNSCVTAADCCDVQAECINNVCSAAPPQ
ncbi:MAG: hypothetical protein U0414_37330 [Polyangiaceae bacterium]